MSDNVHIDISSEDVTAINDAVAVLKEKLLPHLIALDADTRRELPKLGDKTVAFVNKIRDYTAQNPELVPSYLDLPELNSDFVTVDQLRSFFSPINQISDMLSDTLIAAGSDILTSSLAYYNYIKGAAKVNVPGAATICDDLKQRFPGRTKKKDQ